MKHRFTTASLAALLTLTVCHWSRAEVTVEEDITYRTAGGEDLQLDIARPEGEGPFPAILFIHGGGWYQGSREGYRDQIQRAAERGYVAATISYRLMQFDMAKKETATAEPRFPAQVHDAKAAVRWLRANAEKYEIDPQRIGVTGGSAGGYLSLMLGLTDPSAGLEGEGPNDGQSSRVHAVVNVFGPTDFPSGYHQSSVSWILRLFMGGEPDEVPQTFERASPVKYISPDDPPVLTLHGDRDKLIPVQQAKLLDEKMKAAGVEHELIVFEGQGHGFTGEAKQQADEAMWRFFEEHLKPSE